MSFPTSPIVVLDSGLGGLTVAKSLRRALPQEDILYFGDTARLPYGTKTSATVTTFVRQIISYLKPFDPKHVVIACNTASALALPGIRSEFPQLTITGVIDPGARAAARAAELNPFPVVGVIATEATVRSGAYPAAIQKLSVNARVIQQATPLLVPIIEEGRETSDPLVALALQQYLNPILKQKPDVLVLGCTHYPILRSLIQRVVGPMVAVIDSADQCAEDVVTRLRARGLVRPPRSELGYLRCFVTDDSPRFAALGSRFLGMEIASPSVVAPDDLYAGAQAAAASVPMRTAI